MADFPIITSNESPLISSTELPQFTDPLLDKQTALIESSINKQNVLQNKQADKAANLLQKDPTLLNEFDLLTTEGQALNTAGSFVAGTANVAGSLLQTPATAMDIADAISGRPDDSSGVHRNITDVVKDAFIETAEVGKDVSKFGEQFYNTVNTDRQQMAAEEAFDKSNGFWNTFVNLSEVAISHPTASLEQIAGSIPQILEIAAVPVVAFTQMASDRVQEATQIYKDTHGGVAPEGEDAIKLALIASSAAAVELVEGQFLLGKFNKSLAPSAKQLANPLINNMVTRTVANITTGAGAEVLQEGGSQLLTEYAGKQTALDNESIKKAAVASTMAATSGAGLKAGIPAITDTVQALKSGAVAASKLATKEDIAPSELTPEAAVDFKTAAKDVDTALENIASKGSNIDSITKAIDNIGIYETQVNALQEGKDKEAKLAHVADLNKKITEITNEFIAKRDAKAKEVVNVITDNTASIEETKSAVDEVVSLIKNDPNISAEVASDVLGSKAFKLGVESGSITTDQVKTLEDYIAFRKSVEEVSKEVYEGGGGNKGLKNYLAEASIYAQTNNSSALDKSIVGLTKWGKSQAKKLENKRLYNETKGVKGTPGKDGAFHTPKHLTTVAKDLLAIRETYKKLVDIRSTITTPVKTKSTVQPATVAPKGPTVVVEEDTKTLLNKVKTVPDSVRKERAIEYLNKAISTKTVVSKSARKAIDILVQAKEAINTVIPEGIVEVETSSETTVNESEPNNALVDSFLTAINKTLDLNVVVDSEITAPSIGEVLLTDSSSTAAGANINYEFQVKPKKGKGIFNQVTDFFRHIGTEKVLDMLKNLSSEEKIELGSITRHDKAVKAIFSGENSLLKIFKSEHYNSKNVVTEDPTIYLVKFDKDNNPYIPENVIGVISTIGHNWLGSIGGSTLINSSQDINKLLQRDSKHEVTHKEYVQFIKIGALRNSIARELGALVYKELGIERKLDSTDAQDGALVDRMKLSLGNMVITSLLETGHLTQQTMSADEYNTAISNSEDPNVDPILALKPVNFIRIIADANDIIPIASQSIIDATKTGDSVLNTVFGISKFNTGPTFKPVNAIVETLKNSTQLVPTKIKDALVKMQQVQWTMKPEMVKLAHSIGREQLMLMHGYIQNVENTQHITEVDSVISKNAAIKREVDQLFDFIEQLETNKGINTPFFFNYNVWKNGRFGLVSNTLNPQTSKIHRHFLGADAWNVTVDSVASREQFKLAVASAFGHKVDSTPKEISIAFFDSILTDSDIKAAVVAITNNDNIEAVQKVVGDKGSHIIEGLVALTKYSETKPFKTNIGMETDGVTSGIIIGQLQAGYTGETSLEILTAGGMPHSGMNYVDHGTWSSAPGNNDNYKQLTVKWMAKYQEMLNASTDKNTIRQNAGIRGLIGPMKGIREEVDGKIVIKEGFEEVINKLGRDMAKNPVMITNYGSSITNVLNQMATKVIREIYKNIAKNKDNPTKILKIQNNINLALNTNIIIPTGQDALAWKLTTMQEDTIRLLIVNTRNDVVSYGKALDLALKSQFGGFLEFRKKVNSAYQVMFLAFQYKYNQALQIAEIANNGIPLSKEQLQAVEDSVAKFKPTVKGPFSDNREEGVLALKTKSIQKKGSLFNTRQTYTRVVKGTTTKSISGQILSTEYVEPGVSPMILMIHTIDAAVISRVLEKMNALGIHDANIFGIDNVVQGTALYNEAFYEISKEYSILGSVNEVMQEFFTEFSEDPKLSAYVNDAIIENIKTFGIGEGKDRISIDLETYKEDFNNAVEANQKARDTLFNEKIDASGQAAHPDTVYKVSSSIQTDMSDVEAISVVKEFGQDIINKAKERIGSSAVDSDTSIFDFSDEVRLTSENLTDTFNELSEFGIDSIEHQAYLSGILDTVVSGVVNGLDNLNLKLEENEDTSYGFIDKDNSIHVKAGRGQVGNTFQMSAQSIMVHELVHAVTRYGVNKSASLRIELKRLFDNVSKVTTYEDFLNRDSEGNLVFIDEAAERATAQERYNYIFNNSDSAQNYLHEFLAHGLTDENFRKQLSKLNSFADKKPLTGTIFARIQNIWQRILDHVSGTIYGTTDIKVDDALKSLATQFGQYQQKSKYTVRRFTMLEKSINTEASKRIRTWVLKPLGDFLLKITPNPTTVIGKVANVIGTLTDEQKAEAFSEAMSKVYDRMKLVKNGIIESLVREIKGMTKDNSIYHDLHRMSKHAIDQLRLHVATNVTEYLREGFKDKQPTIEEAESLLRVLVKTDISALMNTYSMSEIQKLLTNKDKLQSEIDSYKHQLKAYGENGNYYTAQSRSLGYMLVKGKALVDEQQLNAYNIAQLHNIDTVSATGDLDFAEQTIDKLASLYAIRYSSSSDLENTLRVLQRESALDPTDNGITTLLYSHIGFKEQSLKRLFNGNKVFVVKGYTHEVTDSSVDVRVASGDTDTEQLMLQSGYEKGDKLDPDHSDTNPNTQYMYISTSFVLNTRLKGTVSLTSEIKKGTSISELYSNSIEAKAAENLITFKKAKSVREQFRNPNARSQSENVLIPILNEQGKTAGHRYLMSEHHKRTILNKDDRFDIIMGKMFASIDDKVNTKDINNKVVALARADYNDNYTKYPEKFIEISGKSANPEYAEIYSLMPKDMRNTIKRAWGEDKIIIRKELIDLLFGYRKRSLANAKILSKHYSAQALIRQAEQIWQEIVKVVKVNIVIKNPAVLTGNVVSNTILLGIKGVPVNYMFKQQAIALRALDAHRQQISEKDKLQRRLDTVKTLSEYQKEVLKVRIERLKNDINTNPVNGLINEGLFQSIVEDVSLTENIYEYKTRITHKIEPAISKFIPDAGVSVAKHLYMTGDTPQFRLMLKATQYSDFVARYALYSYRTEVENVEKSKALQETIESFINYDIPSGKDVQWLNDMGLFMFTKFLFRIQKIIFSMLREKPASALSSYVLQEIFGDVSDIPDSSLISFSLGGRANSPWGILDTLISVPGTDALGITDTY